MSAEKCTLYIKGDQSTKVISRDVTLGDLLAMECTNPHIIAKLKTQKILKLPDKGRQRYVLSVLKVIECIHQEYPNLEIQNIGAPDMIVVYDGGVEPNPVWKWCKVVGVSLVCFVGAAFAIMTFNNDSGTSQLFVQMYELFTGRQHEGFSVLELTYSIGLTVGILIFFNHFGRHKAAADPTPIEVEMRLYENDIETTLIIDRSRRGKEIDVD